MLWPPTWAAEAYLDLLDRQSQLLYNRKLLFIS